ncbi:uncharacterized protein LOC127842452 isoform X3 [Dreissena polymorpha]|uniref:uncharacterized protein LOC127842452 isoform X3 n=1 Tax=Dreissena polymorpha TaxID=45954 RepID=UPI0022651A2F|nr:uncharacterized protein LOC127842452 isoform X3 [Dreissena polymorpha]
MSKGEKKQLIRRQKENAGTFSKKEYVMTVDKKTMMSQGKIEHQIEMEKLFPDGRGHNLVLVKEDVNATQQLPDKYRGQFYCGTSTMDGNCLFHACSLAVWGDESQSAKLRKYTADELLTNPGEYCTNHPYIKHFVQKLKLNNDELLAMYHVMFDDSVKTIKSDTLTERIRDEGQKTQNNGRYSSLLHVLALSTVLQRPIQSIYPKVPWIYRELYHGTIQPLPRKPKELFEITPKKITLFWTGVSHDEASLVPTHIVPVFSKNLSETPISHNLSVSNKSLYASTVSSNSNPKPNQNMSSDTSHVTSDSGRKQPLRSDKSSAVNIASIEQDKKTNMSEGEKEQLIRRQKENAGTFSKKEYVMTDKKTNMSEGENKPLIHAGTIPKKEYVITADRKITISQIKNEHRIEMEKLPPDDRCLNPMLVKEDENSTIMLRDEYQSQFYFGTSTGDGNCLYHACSLAICGDESLSAKLRQDTADELLKNPGEYCTNHPYIDRFVKEKNLDNDAILAMYHVMFDDSVKAIKSEELIEHIRDEGKKTQSDRPWSSLLHVLALSTVLQRPIQSICPEVPCNYRELYLGTIQPLPRKPKEITLFWGVSRVGSSLVPSHIVPIFSKQDRGLNPLLVKKDKKATKMLPDQSQFYCGTSTGDGNCLYHACSLAICGDESLSAQLRQDTAAELLKNPGDYCTNHPYIDRFVQEKNLDNDAKLAMYHVMFEDSVKAIKSDELIERIRDEGKKTQNDRRWFSLLHVLALSTVLQRPIQSICPEVPRTFRELYNGTIQPLPRKPKEPKEITLFWTGVSRVGATLVPSHIVPVLSKQDNMNTDSTIFKGCLTCQKKIPVYETKCLTKGCSNHVDPGYLKIEQGDHIEVPAEGCCGLFINHHAIVDSFECSNNGNGKIQVIDVPYKPTDSKLIIENHTLQYKDNIDLSTVKIIKYKRPLNDKKETHKRAKQHISKDLVDEKYHLFVRNCEHFASTCVNGNDPITIDNKFTHAASLQTIRCVVILFHAFCLLTMSAMYLVNVLVYIGFVGDDERLKQAFCLFKSCYIGKNHGFTNTICDWEILAGYAVLLFVISCVITLYRCRCGLWIGDCECGCGRHRRMCFQCIWSSFIVMISKILCISAMESKNFLLERFWLQIYQPLSFGWFITILLLTVIIESLIVYFLASYYFAKILVWLFGKCVNILLCKCWCEGCCCEMYEQFVKCICGCIDEDSHDYCVRHGFV